VKLAEHNPDLSLGLGRSAWTLGVDHQPIMRVWFRRELSVWQESAVVKGVQILVAPEACEQCRILAANGRVWTIDEALLEEPLPCSHCKSDAENSPINKGWCRCTYLPVLDESE
jgi:predicted Zn-ribbon and HTH transcriptional regulator